MAIAGQESICSVKEQGIDQFSLKQRKVGAHMDRRDVFLYGIILIFYWQGQIISLLAFDLCDLIKTTLGRGENIKTVFSHLIETNFNLIK